MSARSALPASWQTVPVVAVLRADKPEAYDAVLETLVEEGVTSLELTLTTPGTIAHLPALRARLGDAAEIGVGTVTTEQDATDALDAGADFLVTPVTSPGIITLAVDRGVPIFPGAMTPTEVHTAWQAGATAVKLFPAATLGADYGSHLRGPFPDLQFIPSGGIGLDQIAPWLSAGAAAVSIGSPMIGNALKGGSLDELRTRVRNTLAAVQAARGLR